MIPGLHVNSLGCAMIQEPSPKWGVHCHPKAEAFERNTNLLLIDAPVAIRLVQNQRIVFSNPILQKLTGFTEDDLIGEEPSNLIIFRRGGQGQHNAGHSGIAFLSKPVSTQNQG